LVSRFPSSAQSGSGAPLHTAEALCQRRIGLGRVNCHRRMPSAAQGLLVSKSSCRLSVAGCQQEERPTAGNGWRHFVSLSPFFPIFFPLIFLPHSSPRLRFPFPVGSQVILHGLAPVAKRCRLFEARARPRYPPGSPPPTPGALPARRDKLRQALTADRPPQADWPNSRLDKGHGFMYTNRHYRTSPPVGVVAPAQTRCAGNLFVFDRRRILPCQRVASSQQPAASSQQSVASKDGPGGPGWAAKRNAEKCEDVDQVAAGALPARRDKLRPARTNSAWL